MSGRVAQMAVSSPRSGVRLKRETYGEYTLHDEYRITRTDDGDWEITAVYDGWREARVRRNEQAIAFHGARWQRLSEVREVLPAIMATQHAISTGRVDPRDWEGGR